MVAPGLAAGPTSSSSAPPRPARPSRPAPRQGFTVIGRVAADQAEKAPGEVDAEDTDARLETLDNSPQEDSSSSNSPQRAPIQSLPLDEDVESPSSLTREARSCVLFSGLCGVLLGYDIGVVAGALLPVQQHFKLSPFKTELFVGALNMVALPGSAVGGPLADLWGRRPSIGFAAMLFFGGNSLLACAWSYESLMLGRVTAGFAVGITLVVSPLYTAEVAPARLRGMLTSFMEVAFNVGIVFGYVAGWALQGLPPPANWRAMLGVGSLPPLAITVGVMCAMSETPRWLAANGRLEEAEEVLRRVVGEAEAVQAMAQLRAQHSPGKQKAPTMGWLEIVSSPETRWSVLLGMSVAFFSQSTGVETVVYYSNVILRQAGVPERLMLLATMCIGIAKLLALGLSATKVDRWGRRPLLLLSGSGMGLTMALLGASFLKGWHNALRVFAMVLFVVAFSFGFGPITYVFNAEIYPQRCRSKGMSMAIAVSRITSAVVATSFLSLSQALTYAGAFLFYAFMGVLGTLFVLLCVPETKGLTLEESGDAVMRQQSSAGNTSPAGGHPAGAAAAEAEEVELGREKPPRARRASKMEERRGLKAAAAEEEYQNRSHVEAEMAEMVAEAEEVWRGRAD